MKPIDQCPSSHKEGLPGKASLASEPRVLNAVAGSKSWRGLDEQADDPAFRDWVEREFPSGASELLEGSRRDFLKLMGASVALAGAATIPGCRRPEHEILPYSKESPEDVIPGKPVFYATSLPLPCGGAEGLLVETHEGRPTKIEGNPLHPASQGKSSLWAQASVLELYDPDRLKFPVVRLPTIGEKAATWDDFAAWASDHLGKFDAAKGEGLAIVVHKHAGPSREAQLKAIKARWPLTQIIRTSSVETRGGIEGTQAAFATPQRERLQLAKAKVILSLSRDFLNTTGEPGGMVQAREFASTRRVLKAADEMSRLYVAEPAYTLTGGQADHRLAMPASQIARVAAAVAMGVLAKVGGEQAGALRGEVASLAGEGLESAARAWVEAAVEDLLAAGSAALIVAGPNQPPAVHALAHALNAALGSIGTTITYDALSPEDASDGRAELGLLATGLSSGAVRTVVCVGVNPAYDMAGFADAMAKATTITWSIGDSETAAASNWSLNGSHTLENWGDARASDGTISPIQPMIAPLYEPAMSEIEFLAVLAKIGRDGGKNLPKVSGYELVREAWQGVIGQAGFEKAWKRALFDGVLPNSGKPGQSPTVDFARVAASLKALTRTASPTTQGLEVVFTTNQMYDGRLANCAWLQELPEVATRICWDNPALISPKTAIALGLTPSGMGTSTAMDKLSAVYSNPKYPNGRVVTLNINGRSMEVALWVSPGVADNTIILTLGYGRTHAGLVGNGVGFNTFQVFDGRPVVGMATLRDTGRDYELASTQTHWSIEGRTSLVRTLDLPAWKKHGDDPPKEFVDRLYSFKTSLNLGERIGHSELTHTPPNISIYEHPYNKSRGDAAPGSIFATRPQWAMSIDLATCTGCGTCTVACQAENNIPVVGKKEVAKGRELTWIRVDRYFTGEDANNPEAMIHQPIACVHCENAPCEVVCPVNATIHGTEGLNYMTYNRCIGTRYCANNCPYKVRRFNFFDYGVKKFKGEYIGEDLLPQAGERNVNLVPPRLREKLNEIEKMHKNPNVTIRSRGVMERCSMCIQRINAAKIECKINDVADAPAVPEGFFQTACQQACPSHAITFGDLLDEKGLDGKGSQARQMRNNNRTYALLGYLDTRPRTTHMVQVRNPNVKLLEKLGQTERLGLIEDPFYGGHGGGHGGAHGGDDGHGHDAGHAPVPAGKGHSMKPRSPVPWGSPDDPSRSAFLRDQSKRALDQGYALSLKVLSPMTTPFSGPFTGSLA
jgi:MoCo/4Fe-4S cofactor protein with predicted Tat translocation signal